MPDFAGRRLLLSMPRPYRGLRFDETGMSEPGFEEREFADAAHRPLARRHVFAAVIGNALEFYDFTTYAFFSISIGHAFFPNLGEYVNLMLSLGIFAAGFVMRPIGGLVIGTYGDKVGRKPAMVLSFAMMGAAIVALALIPPFSVIGWAAPILALLARAVQGFALGGEVGPTTAYLFEAAPVERRGLYASFQSVSQSVASLVGGIVGVVLAQSLDASTLDAWGWRIAFLLGGATLPFGLIMRRALPETLHAQDHLPAHAPLREGISVFRSHWRPIAFGLMVFAAGTVATYTLNYLTTYARGTLHMQAKTSFAATLVLGAFGILAAGAGGWLCDRIGRKPVMIWPRVLFLLAIYPIFLLIVRNHDATALLFGSAALSVLANFSSAAIYAALSEGLPKEIRGRGFATIYALSITVFGGSTQSVLTWLIHVTGDPMSPAWYLMAFTALGVAGVVLIAETAPVRIAPLAVALRRGA
jgi:MHS family citrate/tricarballylate:H+ symporter-like MFS transporter